jgi:hypothetical protein
MHRIAGAALFLFALGAVLGTAGDIGHVLTGTTAYAQGVYVWYFLDVMPWWVPLLFGGAAVAIGLSHPWMDRILGAAERPGTRSAGRMGLGLALFLALYLASGLLPHQPYRLDHAVVAAGALGLWLALDRTWQGAVMAAGTAAAGTAVEMFLIGRGVFWYGVQSVQWHGVADWLPWLYAAASVAVGNCGRRLLREGRAVGSSAVAPGAADAAPLPVLR